MSPYTIVALTFGAVLFDLSFAPGASVLGARPSLTLVLVGLWATLRPPSEAMLLAPVAGLLLGLLGNEPLGASVLALVPVVLLGGLYAGRPGERRLLISLAVVIVGTLAYAVAYLLLVRLSGGAVPLDLAGARRLALVALLNGALATVLYWPLARAAGRAAITNELRR